MTDHSSPISLLYLSTLCNNGQYCHDTTQPVQSPTLCIQIDSSEAHDLSCGDILLQAAQAEAERQNDAGEQERWRKRIFRYLDWLFRRDANAGADFAGLQVCSSCSLCQHSSLE